MYGYKTVSTGLLRVIGSIAWIALNSVGQYQSMFRTYLHSLLCNGASKIIR